MTVRRALVAIVLPAALLAAAVITAAAGAGTTAKVGSGTASAAQSVCGLGNGKKATGTPIKIGAIATKQPGTDFTDIPNMAQAYFNCVNDNGGIYGHPIKYYIETEQTNPAQIAGLAKKLVSSDHVVAVVGNTSLIECTVDHKYWEQQGFFVIDSGIAPECYSTSHSAAVNMGPRYSSDGAAQYVLSQHVNKLIFDQSNVPGLGYNSGGVELISKAAGVPEQSLADDVPIQDANSVALKLVQAAGSSGGIVLNFTPDQAALILQAAQKQGLEDSVKAWACSTPCNSDFLAQSLGSAWDNKLFVNAELNLTGAPGPDGALYRAIIAKYKPKLAFGVGSFSQMGFVEGRIAVAALLSMGKGASYTVKTVNAAIENVKNFKTDILCKPWYYGNAPLHIPNNTDRTVTPSSGKMVLKQGCTGISAVDPAIAKVRAIEKKQGIK
ncbi:MAG TPA: ABC transporter substrate-binding protein [Gaiellaceae bacterium]|jgi:branched-chain amino acid transport system substrate-binding protein|nr:ABC transporter substrate-binding protein [Gaiellaceae bacterium]